MDEITFIDIYEYLPNINCGKCGVGTCLEFSHKIFSGKFKPNRCVHLYKKGNEENIKELEKIYITFGYNL